MRTRLGLKVLGLSALAMSVMAIAGTGVAHAETGACFGYLNGAELKCFSATLEAKVNFEFENKTATLSIANLNFEILCTGTEFIEGGSLSANGSILLGRILLTGCIGLSVSPKLEKLASCTPTDPVKGAGVIVSEKVTGLIILHTLANGEKEAFMKITPDTAETLVIMFLGEGCAVGEELLVKGSLDLVDSGGRKSFEEHKLIHLFEESKALHLMKVGSNLATLSATVQATLAVPHNALKWGGKAA